MKDTYYLYAQIVLIIALLYFGSFINIFNSGILTLIFTIGITIALWAFYNMGLDTFSPFPQPKKSGKHVQLGIYKYVRHPMYTGIALTSLSLFLSDANFPTFLFFAILIYVLDSKATIEEKYLSKIYPTYTTYTKSTKKFIPYIY